MLTINCSIRLSGDLIMHLRQQYSSKEYNFLPLNNIDSTALVHNSEYSTFGYNEDSAKNG